MISAIFRIKQPLQSA